MQLARVLCVLHTSIPVFVAAVVVVVAVFAVAVSVVQCMQWHKGLRQLDDAGGPAGVVIGAIRDRVAVLVGWPGADMVHVCAVDQILVPFAN